jgi:hypothetical protein
MSVEFQTKINIPITIAECVDEMSKVLALLLGMASVPRIEGSSDGALDLDAPIGRASRGSFTIAIGDDSARADVSVDTFEGAAFQEEAGTWLSAEASPRTDPSFVVALSFACAVARKTHSTVLDDAGHLRLGRHVNPDRIIDHLRLHETSESFQEAVELFCRNAGFHFGDQ